MRRRRSGVRVLWSVLALNLASGVASSQQSGSVREPRLPLPGAPAGVTAFVNVAVVPMDTERVLLKQTVLVQQGWITALGPSSKVKVPPGAVRIDGRGKFLIPGLSDMHLHVPSFRRGYHDTKTYNKMFSPATLLEAERMLFLTVANGVTTVRIMNGRPGMLLLRERAARGELWSPRMIVASPSLYSSIKGLQGGKAALVEEFKAAGYDLIKMYFSPVNAATPWWDSLVAAARRAGLPIAGHVPRFGDPVAEAVRAGYRSIEHRFGKEYPDIPALAAQLRRANLWFCPTMAYTASLIATTDVAPDLLWRPEHRYYKYYKRFATRPTASTTTGWDSLAAVVAAKVAQHEGFPSLRRRLKALYDAGAPLLLGTDANDEGDHLLPGFTVHAELAEFVAAGLRPYDALVIGTRNAAEFLGTLDSVGTVAEGKRADLVLLAGNPLVDIRHTREPAGVMVGGRWLGRAELDARLQALEGTLGCDEKDKCEF